MRYILGEEYFHILLTIDVYLNIVGQLFSTIVEQAFYKQNVKIVQKLMQIAKFYILLDIRKGSDVAVTSLQQII